MHKTEPEQSRPRGERVDRPGTLIPFAEQRARYRALASLLGDDSVFVRDEVRRQYESAGRAGLPSLERALNDASPTVRGRARTLLLEREKTLVIRRLLRYISGQRIDLETALFLLARYQDPRLDPRPSQAELESLAREVEKRTHGIEDPLDRAQIMVEFLATEIRFGSAKGDFHHPDNAHIHRVIERRRGMPLALCAIYMFVGRRAGIRTACVPLPGLVMLRLHGNGQSKIVDPYNKGLVRSDRECREYLRQHGLPVRSNWFKDADDVMLLKRQVANLVRSADLRGLPREKRELGLVARALDLRQQLGAPSGA